MANDNKTKTPVVESKTANAPTVEPAKAATQGESVSIPQTSGLVEKHKRKYTRRQKSDVEAENSAPVVAVNLELLKKSIHAIAGSIDGVVVRGLHRKAKRVYDFLAPSTAEQDAKELALSASLSGDELEVSSEAASVLFAQNPFLIKHAPWVMLAGVGVSYSTRVVIAFSRLDSLEKKVAALQTKQVQPAQPIINRKEGEAN